MRSDLSAYASLFSDPIAEELEGWFRKDNYLPLQLKLYDRANVFFKIFEAQEVPRIDGTWFITKSRMCNVSNGQSTEFLIDSVAPLKGASDDEFTVRSLEKLASSASAGDSVMRTSRT